ncbi:MAG TPA: hypothetical protein DHV72_00475 [Serratia grimesii]|uniref:Peptidase C58 YopT-type domain-containing protein n=2 Tax=Serratia grimesii TaxID=82995 RepID=A0A9C7QRE3_9GAMM|nr:hypothetical protein [Serratia grimesii]
MSLCWINCVMSDGGLDSPEKLSQFYQASLFQNEFNKDSYPYEKLKFAREVLREKHSYVIYEIAGGWCYNSPVDCLATKGLLGEYLQRHSGSMICLLLFINPGLSQGHAVALYRDENNKHYYFYDPNEGVYLCEVNPHELLDSIKRYLHQVLKLEHVIVGGLFVKIKS